MSRKQPNWGTPKDQRQRLERTLSYTSASNPGLLQTFINKTVEQLTLREFGLQSIIPRKQGSGDKVYINQRTEPSSGAAWISATGTTVAPVNGTYAQVSFQYRTCATGVRVMRQLRAMGRSYGDVLAIEMAAKAEDYAAEVERALIIGDSAVTSNCINGFITMMQGSNTGGAGSELGQMVPNTAAQGEILLAELDECIDKVKGSGDRSDLVIIGSFKGLRCVNKVLQANQRFMEYGEVGAGFRVRTYDGIPMIVSTGMPDDLTFNGSTGELSAASGGAQTCLMVLNLRHCYISELTPMTVEPLAKISTTYDEAEIYSDFTAVWGNTKGGALLTGITF